MNIINDLMATRDRIDDAIKALQAIGLKPSIQPQAKTEIPIHPELTPREKQVLELLAGGMDTHEAAEKLGIKKKTIEATRDNIRKKTGIPNSHKLIEMAKEGRI